MASWIINDYQLVSLVDNTKLLLSISVWNCYIPC